MSLIGESADWSNLIDSLVPDILELVSSSWSGMPVLEPGAREDPTTEKLCRLLRQNRASEKLPFQIHIQMVELDPDVGQDQGRMDITFVPLVPREDVYFCLECKRLNVVDENGTVRAYAAEYVRYGMMRFVTGQYAKTVRHGGMLAYVLNGNVNGAIQNIRAAIQARHQNLGMTPPGELLASSIRPDDAAAKETQHARYSNASLFQIHHLFVPGLDGEVGQVP